MVKERRQAGNAPCAAAWESTGINGVLSESGKKSKTTQMWVCWEVLGRPLLCGRGLSKAIHQSRGEQGWGTGVAGVGAGFTRGSG